MRAPGTRDELAALAARERYRLCIVKGPAFVGAGVELDPDRPYTFGRAGTCALQLPGATVSRRQFSLHWIDGRWVLKNAKASTGTLVDGLTVVKQELAGGELIEAGSYQLKFFAPAKRASGAHRPVQVATSAAVAAPRTPGLTTVPTGDSELADEQPAQQALIEALDATRVSPETVGEATENESQLSRISPVVRRGVFVLCAVAVGLGWLATRNVFWKGDTPAELPVSADANESAPVSIPSLPSDFVRALDAMDFELAHRLLDEVTSDAELLSAMQDRLDSAIAAFRADLLREARAAVLAQEWDEVDRILSTASDPVLGDLPSEWHSVQDALARQRQLASAQEAPDQRAPADAAVPAEPATRPTDETRGAGLRVTLATPVDGVQLRLDDHDIALARNLWDLKPGSADLLATAPGYIDHAQSVTLEAGRLLTVPIKLVPKPPAALWALLSLQHARLAEPLWVAAQHYGAARALDASVTDRFTKEAERKLTREPGRTTLRVARIALKSGDVFTARIWTDSAGRLGINRLPSGAREVINTEDVETIQDLELEEAATEAFQVIQAARQAGASPLDALKLVARFRADLGAANQSLATRVCRDLVDECLHTVEDACGCCAGTTRVTCPKCDGSGFVMRTATCERCRGAGKLPCTDCSGKGHATCRVCGGRGKLEERARGQVPCETCGGTGSVPGPGGGRVTCTSCGGSGWHWQTRSVFKECAACAGKGALDCPRCKGEGKVECPKCKGDGHIDDRQRCPQCDKGLIVCECCQGNGTRDGMLEARGRELELQAAESISH